MPGIGSSLLTREVLRRRGPQVKGVPQVIGVVATRRCGRSKGTPMFTGIIEEAGRVVHVTAGSIRISADRVVDGTELGQSIAIDGVDITVTEIIGSELVFNVMPETYRQSTLGRVAVDTRVNLERSLRRPTQRKRAAWPSDSKQRRRGYEVAASSSCSSL